MKYLLFGFNDKLAIGFARVIALGCGVSNAAAQTDKYPRMAAIGEYLMEKNAEIQGAKRRSRFHFPRRDDHGSGTAGIRDSR